MADLLDVLTIDEARAAVQVEAVDHDDRIAAYVTAVSRRMDELIGPVVQRTVTEYHDGGVHVIRPRQTPVASITSLTEASGTATTVLTEETFGTTPADAYVLDVDDSYAHRCRIYRRAGGRDWTFALGAPQHNRNVQLVYVAGRAATTAAVDERIKQTAAMVLRLVWRREESAWAQSPSFFDAADAGGVSPFFRAVDPRVTEMLADELKPHAVA